ncbi:MAG: response regulator [Deltaproteobacteria bacterium]|jgi:signal transduction histidine kinase/HPt (histidine-containing phosphotransfer) domain-containing protein/ActR/RegA family two-component response regulator|nr:response regulator [Deltaproteobacteria bacterium]
MTNKISYKSLIKENITQLLYICAAFFLMMFLSGWAIHRVITDNLTRSVALYLDKASLEVAWYLDEPTVAFRQVGLSLANILDDTDLSLITDQTGLEASKFSQYINEVNRALTAEGTGIRGVSSVYGYIGNKFVHSENQAVPADFVPQNRLWYQSGMNNQEPRYTMPYRDSVTGKMIISLSQKVTGRDGTYHGVLALDLDLDVLNDYAMGLSMGEGSFGILVNEYRYILSHPDEKKRFLYFDNIDGQYARISDLIDSGERFAQTRLMNSYGVDSIVSLQRMDNGWVLGLVVPASSYYRGLRISLGILLTCGLMVMLLLCFTILRLNSAKRRLEAESRNKTSFLARISHEIRTPMNAIIGMSELLLRLGEQMPHRALAYCGNIKLASGNLLSIINDILDFSKIDSGGMALINDKYTLASLIDDVTNITRVRLTDESTVLVIDLDPNLPNNLYGDVLKIRQCLLNFLSNSVKYTKLGSICLEITGQLEGLNLTLRLAVKDTGIGIKRQDLEKLFHDFVRLDPVTNMNVEGTGLGLVITKRLCELMGGQIDVTSSYGHGSVFTMTLPQVVVSPEPIATVVRPETMSLLIYEERLPISRSIALSLAALGVPNDLVSTGERFRSKLSQGGWTHLILPAAEYPAHVETIAELAQGAWVGLTVKESQPVGSGKVSYLPTPVYCLTLANFLNSSSGVPGLDVMDAPARGTGVTMPQARVLVVDDLETNLIVAEGLMEGYGLQIDLCRGGREAVEMVQANEYDLVFMDHMMPGLDGIEATRLIRSLEGQRFLTLPVIALTANAVHGMKEMFLDHGLNDFLAKPIDSSKLEEILLAWIPREKQVSAQAAGWPSAAGDGHDGQGNGQAVQAGPLAGHQGDTDGDSPWRTANLDTAAGLSRSGGKIDNYRRLLRVFAADAEKARDILGQALERDDLRGYAIHVHALKGATATIGAQGLSDLAKELEMAGRQENMAYVTANTPRFLEYLSQVMVEVKSFLEAAAPPPEAPAIDRDVAQCLRKLGKAFEEVDTATIGLTLGSLRTGGTDPGLESVLDKIYGCFLDVEYDQALDIINGLLAGPPDQEAEPGQSKKMLN